MSTFAQICGEVFEEADGRVVTFSSTDLGADQTGALYVEDPTQRNVIRWVKQAYREILDITPYWSFLRARGTVLKIKADKTTYATSIPRIRDYSLFFRATGSSVRIPVYLQPYSWWVELEQSLYISSGQPIYLIDSPADDYIIWPTPNRDGEIYGDYWLVGDDLSSASDEPIWAERFHDVLVWRTLQKFATEFEGEGVATRLISRVNLALPSRWNAFKREYFPSAEGPCVNG